MSLSRITSVLNLPARGQVRVLRKLHHRNIVQFYGACLEPGAMFFVTELMKGGDLYSALRQAWPCFTCSS